MQVFVYRSDLRLTADELVRVASSYDDGVAIAPAAHPGTTVLSLSSGAIRNVSLAPPTLVAGWREANRIQIATGEAERRILAAFPDFQQRNSAAELMGYLAVYGATSATWPREAQSRKAEIDRAWAYVNAVRHASDGMLAGALPADPTADSHWPARMSAYKA